jgi:hypothetical protein
LGEQLSNSADKAHYGSVEDRPWEDLPPELADVLRRDIPAIYGEMIEAMGSVIPAYERPLEGEFGRNVRRGIDHGFDVFFDLIAHHGEIDPDPFRKLGRIEFRAGRSLDALQAMYRLGGRVAWHNLSATATANGFDGDVLRVLAEALFAFVDRLTRYSIEGYNDARATAGSDVEAARLRLVELLITGEADQAQLERAARQAGRRLPATVAALVLDPGDLSAVAVRCGGESLQGSVDGLGVLLVADPDGPARADLVRNALNGAVAALGSTVAPVAAHTSVAWARRTWDLVEQGELQPGSPVSVDASLAPLLLHSEVGLIERIVDRRLAPLRSLRPAARERLAETLLCWLRLRGDRRAIAEELHIHVQTVRYRMAQLRELFGPALDCPETRFELEIALRSMAPGNFASI